LRKGWEGMKAYEREIDQDLESLQILDEAALYAGASIPAGSGDSAIFTPGRGALDEVCYGAKLYVC
jgi:hypothetical protein